MAAVKTLELQCPHCRQILELDAGFAGGVCRCSSCGTLMSVPGLSAERAAVRQRPDRPDAPVPAGKSAGTGSVIVRAVQATEEQVQAAATARAAGAAIPTARPRKPPRRWVKYLTTAAVVLMLAGIAAVVAFALVIRLRQDKGPSGVMPPKPLPPPAAVGINAADPAANLFSPDQSGFLGFAWGTKTTLVLDATADARQYLPLLRPALTQALAKAPPETAVQVVLWTDLGEQAYPDDPRVLTADDRAEVDRFLRAAVPAGPGDAAPAVAQALLYRPERLILVAGAVPSSEALAKLRGSTAAIDALLIGAHSPELQQIAESHRGRYISVPMDLLEKWRDQAGLNTPDR